MGKTTRSLALGLALVSSACGAADNRIDPGDLALRDLLGIAPEAALAWDGAQRAAARAVLDDGLDVAPPGGARVVLAPGRSRDERVARTLAAIDRGLAADGDDALGLVRVALDATALDAAPLAGPRAAELTAGRAAAPPEPVEL